MNAPRARDTHVPRLWSVESRCALEDDVPDWLRAPSGSPRVCCFDMAVARLGWTASSWPSQSRERCIWVPLAFVVVVVFFFFFS